MRIIDADRFIKWLDVGHLRSPSEVCLSELDVKKMIDLQPTIEVESKWILCSERVPKQNEHIIGTFKNINEGSNLVFGVNFYYDLLNEPMPLIAWMPLPEPYRGEEK